MDLTIIEWVFMVIAFFISAIIGVIIKYKDIENNSVRYCLSDSVKKLESKKPPNWEGK